MCKELQELIDEVTDEASRKAELNKIRGDTFHVRYLPLFLSIYRSLFGISQALWSVCNSICALWEFGASIKSS